MATEAKICANRPNAQESDSTESEHVRKITYEIIRKICKTNPISEKSNERI